MNVKKRYLVDDILPDLDEKMVFIGGARQVGKTSMAKYIAENHYKSSDYLNWDVREAWTIIEAPLIQAAIYNNWFAQEKPGAEVLLPWPASPESNVFLYNNAFGRTKPVIFE